MSNNSIFFDFLTSFTDETTLFGYFFLKITIQLDGLRYLGQKTTSKVT